MNRLEFGWSHKILPIVYDESLSYYEVLCKFVKSLNSTIENVNELVDGYKELYDYVHDYFKNLNVQEEINNKIDEMLADGSFALLLYNIIGFVTPTMYGAKGDGVTNDTEAFQSAFDSGKNVKILGGTYVIDKVNIENQNVECLPGVTIKNSEPIEMKNSTFIEGKIEADANGIRFVSGKNFLNNTDIVVSKTGALGISCFEGEGVIENCNIDGSETAQFGVWADNKAGVNNDFILSVNNCDIHDFWLNGIFSSARVCNITNNRLTHNHIQEAITGGGQIDIVGKQTQGLTVISGNLIGTVGGRATSGIELEASGHCKVEGNRIEVNGGLYGIAVQSSNATINGNTIIGGDSAIACLGQCTINTSDNWLSGATNNITINNGFTHGSINERRYTGELFDFRGDFIPVINTEECFLYDKDVAPRTNVSFFNTKVHAIIAILDSVVEYIVIDGVNNVMTPSNIFTYGNGFLTFSNGEETKHLKVVVIE